MDAYAQIGWLNDQAPAINKDNLNHMDDGIANAILNNLTNFSEISALNDILGLSDSFTIHKAIINSSGVIESGPNNDVFCAEVEPGTKIDINVSPTANFIFSFFTSKPAIGSHTYDGGRIVVWETSRSNIIVPAGVQWVGIRVALNQIPTLNIPIKSGLIINMANYIQRVIHDYTQSTFDANDGVINTYLYIQSSNTGETYHFPANSGAGYLFTFGVNDNIKSQLYVDSTNKNMYVRRYISGWESWHNIAEMAISSAINALLGDVMKRYIPSSPLDANDADLNTYSYIGSSNVGSTYNMPENSGVGYLVTIGDTNASKGQIYIETRGNKIYFRTHITSWSAWSNILDNTLKNGGTITSTFDFNDATKNAWHGILSNSCTNAPVDGTVNGLCFTFSYTSTAAVQIFVAVNSGRLFIRMWSSNQWSAWVSAGGGGGAFNYEKTVSTAADLYNELVNMPLYSHIIVEPGDYDISQYIEANGEIHFKRGCWLEGREKANIICNFENPSETESIILMGRGWEKISGITFTGSKVRYLIHDEMGGGNAAFAAHEYIDCDFNYTSPKFETVYDICRSFGCGLGNNVSILIENCTFNDTNESCINIHSNSVVYHPDQPQPFAPARIYVKDCYSDTSTLVYYSVTGDTGTIKNDLFVCNNAFNAPINTQNRGPAFNTRLWNNAVITSE